MTSSKKYGLIIPAAKKAVQARKAAIFLSKPSVFGDESSDEDAHKEVNVQIHKEAMKKKIRKQTQIEIQKALEQDATVYEYDSIYDDLKEQNKKKTPAEVSKADKQKKPKYIAKLLKAADRRTKEQERRDERKIQKEREKEGGEFDDKPEFVTSTYRQRMLERQQEIEEEKRMDVIEDALDVRKQKDMSGFYRNFLNRELCEVEPKVEPKEGKKTSENHQSNDKLQTNNEDEDTDLSFSSDESSDEGKPTSKKTDRSIKINPKRKDSSSSYDSSSAEKNLVSRKPSVHSESDGGDESSVKKDSKPRDNSRGRERDSQSRNHGHDSPRDGHKQHSRDRDAYFERYTRRSPNRDGDYSRRRHHNAVQRDRDRSRSRSPVRRSRRSPDRSRSPRRDRSGQSSSGRHDRSPGRDSSGRSSSSKRDRSPRRDGSGRTSSSKRERSPRRDGSGRSSSTKRERDSSEKLSKRDSSRSASPPTCKEKLHTKSESQTPDQKNNLSVSEGDETKVVVGPKPEEETKASSFAKRTGKDKARLAQERYLARKAAARAKPIAEPDSE